MIKVLVACGCGMGSSQLIKMNCSKVLNHMGVEHTIYHTSIDEAKSIAHDYQLIVVGENFVKSFQPKEGTMIIGLKNLMNKKELETKLQESGVQNIE